MKRFFAFLFSFLVFFSSSIVLAEEAVAVATETDWLDKIISLIPGSYIVWTLAIFALLQAIQVFLEFVVKKLDKDPNTMNTFEKIVAYFGKGMGWLASIIRLFTANTVKK